MDCTASEVLAGYDFSSGCLDEWLNRSSAYGSCEEDSSVALDDDVLIRHRRHIRAACRATAQHDRHLRDATGGHLSHIVEDPSEVSLSREDITLPRQVGTS